MIEEREAEATSQILAFLGVLRNVLKELDEEIHAFDASIYGRRATARELGSRLRLLQAEAARVENQLAKCAEADFDSSARSSPQGLVDLAKHMFDELVAVRTAGRIAGFSNSVEAMVEASKFAEHHDGLKRDLDNALAMLQESQQRLHEKHAEIIEVEARGSSYATAFRELRQSVAKNEDLLGTPAEQLARTRAQARALVGLSRSLPLQAGFLITSLAKRPYRLPWATMRMLRLCREMLARWMAARRGLAREPRDVVGVFLPMEWVAEPRYAGHQAGPLQQGSVAANEAGLQGAGRPESIAAARVAIIADEFTINDLEGHCVLRMLEVDRWKRQLDEFRPHLLLVESAWRGNGGQWRGHVDKASGELRALLAHCARNRVPTVFWNKEDPVHYKHFLSTARLFDHVATTDIDRIPDYCASLGHHRVHLMPFGVNPSSRNPLEAGLRSAACSFAGSYYDKYQERNSAFETICDVVGDRVPVRIYDRNHGSDDPSLQFPEKFKPMIVGKLPSGSIDLAYKGYQYAINLNTTPNSQTMVARRVFDLLASNTFTISNYSRAIKLLLGDLLISTNDPKQLAKAWEELHSDETAASKVKLMALRKVMSEHTFEHRLGRLFSDVFGATFEVSTANVVVVGRASSQKEYDAVIEAYRRQLHGKKRLKLVLDPAFHPDRRTVAPDIDLYPEQQVAADPLLSQVARAWIACMDPQDYYGPYYLVDLALGLKYAQGSAVGKAAYYRHVEGAIVGPAQESRRYRAAESLSLRRALIPSEDLDFGTLAELAASISEGRHSTGRCVALDEFSYCEGGRDVEGVEAVDGWTTVDQGLSMKAFYDSANVLANMQRNRRLLAAGDPFDVRGLFPVATHAHRKVLVSHPGAGGVDVKSSLDEGAWSYIYGTRTYEAQQVSKSGYFRFSVTGRGSLRARVAIIFHGEDGQRLAAEQVSLNSSHRLKVPERCKSIRLALRLSGPGTLTISEFRVGQGRRASQSSVLLTRSDRLLIAKGYPSRSRLYHYSFVHRRALSYRRAGLRHAIFRWAPNQAGFDEFEGVDVIAGGADELTGLIRSNQFASLDVHPMYPEMWNVLQHEVSHTPINIWVHGTEIQPWYRRAFNYPPGPIRDTAVRATAKRLSMWRELFTLRHPNLRFVFVSKYLARSAMADVGVQLEEWQYSIIHNFIDNDIFNHVPKAPEQRKRILSIRPYSSPVYANDLAVKVVLELSKQPFFDQLQFLFVGDGALFDETLAPLLQFDNVEIRKGFVTQSEIADLHKQYGLFLVPSRMDTQGVSRDEAMSSGLVPVTNAVAAVPEFVDESCAVLCAAEDWRGMARGITEMYENPGVFLEKSLNAAARARRQSGQQQTIDREIELIRDARTQSQSGKAEAVAIDSEDHSKTRVAIYGDLNLNITDGSAVWAVSLAQVIASLPDMEVFLFLKAPITTLHIVQPLLEIENVRLLEPSGLSEGSGMSVSHALDALIEADHRMDFDAIILRGMELCESAATRPELEDRFWSYITDLPSDEVLATKAGAEGLTKVVKSAKYLLCQTEAYAQRIKRISPAASGKCQSLPPMIPRQEKGRATPRADSALRLVYAGKFAPLWGIHELVAVFGRLRQAFPGIELHVFGDKIHRPMDDPDYFPATLEMLSSTEGLIWHKQLSREELLGRLGGFHAGWAWRPGLLEETTLELSTKILEYASCGLPTLVYPNAVNRDALGEDYPLYARTVEEAEEKLLDFLRDPALSEHVRTRIMETSAKYAFESIATDHLAPLLLPGVPRSAARDFDTVGFS